MVRVALRVRVILRIILTPVSLTMYPNRCRLVTSVGLDDVALQCVDLEELYAADVQRMGNTTAQRLLGLAVCDVSADMKGRPKGRSGGDGMSDLFAPLPRRSVRGGSGRNEGGSGSGGGGGGDGEDEREEREGGYVNYRSKKKKKKVGHAIRVLDLSGSSISAGVFGVGDAFKGPLEGAKTKMHVRRPRYMVFSVLEYHQLVIGSEILCMYILEYYSYGYSSHYHGTMVQPDISELHLSFFRRWTRL